MFAAMPSHAENTPSTSQISEVDASMCQTMRDTDVLHKNAPVSCAQLRIVHFSYLGLDGKVHDDGTVMVMAALADHVQAIFNTLLQRKFALAGAQLMQHYRGDDLAAMRANNTSAFNDRAVTNGSAPSISIQFRIRLCNLKMSARPAIHRQPAARMRIALQYGRENPRAKEWLKKWSTYSPSTAS